MVVEVKTEANRTTRGRIRSHWARQAGVNGHVQQRFGPSHFGLQPSPDQLSKGLSIADWMQTWRPSLAGAEELTNPIEENALVFAATDAKSTAAASVPLCIFPNDEDESEELGESDPVVKLFARPNPLESWAAFAQFGCICRLLTGEDWWLLHGPKGPLVPDNAGRIDLPTLIIGANGDAVEVEIDQMTGLPLFYRVGMGNGLQLIFKPGAALSILEVPDPLKRFRGIGPIDALRRELGVSFQATRYLEGVARAGGDPGAYILLKGTPNADELSAGQRVLDDEIKNAELKGRTKLLTGVESVIPVDTKPKDMEFSALFKWHRELIAGVFGVPAQLLGSQESATFANQEQALRQMWVGPNGVISYLRKIEDKLNNDFFPRMKETRFQKYRAYFDLETVEALREDNSEKVERASRVSVQQRLPINSLLGHFGIDQPIDGGEVAPDPYAGLGLDDDSEAMDADGETGDAVAVGTEESLTGTDVQGQLLNGAQMREAREIVAQVTAAEIPRDSGLAMLETFFGLTAEQAAKIMGSAGLEVTLTPNPSTAPRDPATPGDGDSDTTSGAVDDQELEIEDEKGKSLTRELKPLATKGERFEEWSRSERDVRERGDNILLPPTKKYLRDYLKAQIALWNDLASQGLKSQRIARSAKALGVDSLALTKELAPDDPLLKLLELNREEWDAKLRKAFERPITTVAKLGMSDAANQLESVSIATQRPEVLRSLVESELRIMEGINSTLAKDIKSMLAKELSGATSIGDLQTAIRDALPELTENARGVIVGRDERALRIARTESGAASENGRIEQYKADGVTEIQWITQGDENVREEHESVDGDTVPMGGTFSNGMRHPHDRNAPPGLTINCRCSALAVA